MFVAYVSGQSTLIEGVLGGGLVRGVACLDVEWQFAVVDQLASVRLALQLVFERLRAESHAVVVLPTTLLDHQRDQEDEALENG